MYRPGGSRRRAIRWVICYLAVSHHHAVAYAENDRALLKFEVTPAAAGEQLVRTSLPFRQGSLGAGRGVVVDDGRRSIPAAIRPLGWHGAGDVVGRSVRQALITFPYEFADRRSTTFQVMAAQSVDKFDSELPVQVRNAGGGWELKYEDGPTFRIDPIWPDVIPEAPWTHEVVEENRYVLWQRWKQESGDWRRVVEFRTDVLGQAIAVAHLQRMGDQGHWAPRFGWEITPRPSSVEWSPLVTEIDRMWKLRHSFSTGRDVHSLLERGSLRLSHPAAPRKKGGALFSRQLKTGETAFRYLRSVPHEPVPMQPHAWRRAEFVLSPLELATPTAVLTSPHQIDVDWRDWDASYRVGPPVDCDHYPALSDLLQLHRNAVVGAALVGPDWGNVTAYDPRAPHGAIFGMNRLNHAPAIFFEAMRESDADLMQTALAWCDNFHDLSVWWGPREPGGTRYNNHRAGDNPVPEDDTTFMWRGHRAVTFCTKGYDSFLLAYEQSGDPRMKEALDAQVNYACTSIHADDGECRNIGDVSDFVRLFEFTGEHRYLDEGLRLFRELRTVLSEGNLFDQGGDPIEPDLPFIEEDSRGTEHGYAKPYIIGYGLSGCPRLAKYVPDEPRLRPMITAVADFLATSQDPLGGWRYPPPAVLAGHFESGARARLAIGAGRSMRRTQQRLPRRYRARFTAENLGLATDGRDCGIFVGVGIGIWGDF